MPGYSVRWGYFLSLICACLFFVLYFLHNEYKLLLPAVSISTLCHDLVIMKPWRASIKAPSRWLSFTSSREHSRVIANLPLDNPRQVPPSKHSALRVLRLTSANKTLAFLLETRNYYLLSVTFPLLQANCFNIPLKWEKTHFLHYFCFIVFFSVYICCIFSNSLYLKMKQNAIGR